MNYVNWWQTLFFAGWGIVCGIYGLKRNLSIIHVTIINLAGWALFWLGHSWR